MNRIAKCLVIASVGSLAALTLYPVFFGKRQGGTASAPLPRSSIAVDRPNEAALGEQPLSEQRTTGSQVPDPFSSGETEAHLGSEAAASALDAQALSISDGARLTESSSGFGLASTSDDMVPLSASNDTSDRPIQWCFVAGAWEPSRTGPGWQVFRALEEQAEGYSLASDSSVVWSGSQSAALRTAASERNAAVAWQAIDATPYIGSRIKMSAYILKTQHAARIFIGAHDAESPFLASGRTVWVDDQLSLVWTSVTAEFDVEPWAVVLYYGAGVHNGGSLWLDDIRIERIEKPPPSTPPPALARPEGVLSFLLNPRASLTEPSNLDFEVTTSDADNGAECRMYPL